MKIDVCLEMVFMDLPYEKRIEAISKCGFDLVEFWFHDATFNGKECTKEQSKDTAVLVQTCEKYGVSVNNVVVNAPDGSFGGSPVNAGDLNKYLQRTEEVIKFAKAIGCNKAITCSGNIQPSLTRAEMRKNLEKALSKATEIANKNNFTLLLEPLNTYVDHAGYYLDSSKEASEIVRAINSPNLRLLYDVYHMQIMEGNIIANIQKNIDIIGHFHSAGVPGRHELWLSEVNYKYIVKEIEKMGYKNAFGLEYIPLLDSKESLLKTLEYLEK